MVQPITRGVLGPLVACALVAGTSRAQDEAAVEPGGAAGAGEDPTPLTGEGAAAGPTLPAGAVAIWVALQLGASAEETGGGFAQPLSLAPDLWYGINDRLQVGVVTSLYGITGFWTGALLGVLPSGVCLSGEEGGCPRVFDFLGAEATFALDADGPLQLAAGAGLHARSFDPLAVGLKLGVNGMFRSGRLGIGFAPSLHVGLTERDAPIGDDVLFVPVTGSIQMNPKVTIGLQTGVLGPTSGFGDGYAVPVALGGLFMLSETMVVTAAFSLDRVAGGAPEGTEAPGAADLRSINVSFGATL